MGGSTNPTGKARDSDFAAMMLVRRAPVCACTCACCAAGRCGGHAGGPMSPHGERPLGCEPDGIATEALERRRALIERVLLPEAKALAASMAKANQDGTVGVGELELLGSLHHWVLQLQIELDDLRRCLSPPDLEPKAP
jgi:hypothetical protein